MNYVEQMQTLSKEDATKTIFDALNSKAIDALSEVDEAFLPKVMAAVSTVATIAAKARDAKRLVRDKLGMEAGYREGSDKLIHDGINKAIDKFKR
jgi:hypothetical protein